MLPVPCRDIFHHVWDNKWQLVHRMPDWHVQLSQRGQYLSHLHIVFSRHIFNHYTGFSQRRLLAMHRRQVFHRRWSRGCFELHQLSDRNLFYWDGCEFVECMSTMRTGDLLRRHRCSYPVHTMLCRFLCFHLWRECDVSVYPMPAWNILIWCWDDLQRGVQQLQQRHVFTWQWHDIQCQLCWLHPRHLFHRGRGDLQFRV